MFPLAFVAGWLQGHWWGFISRNYVVWPPSFLWMFSLLLKDLISDFYDFTAAGVVPCGSRKTSPRTSTIVQFIFYFGPLRSAIIFWEIRNKWLFRLIFYTGFYLFGPHFVLYQSLNWLPIWNSQNCSMFPLAFVAGWLQGHWWGFISRNYVVWPTFLLMNVFIALKGSHFWFLLDSNGVSSKPPHPIWLCNW